MNSLRKILAMVCVMIILGSIAPSLAGSGSYAIRKAHREGTWDFILPLNYAEEIKIEGKGGSSAELNDDFGFGFGLGYNLNDHFQLSGLLQWNSRNYDATVIHEDDSTGRYGGYIETFNLGLNGTYYFMDGAFTPFISGLFGHTWVDTNIQDGPTTGVCWYDPWWGYICDYYTPTKTESDWVYGAGLGIRYDVNNQFGIQCSYNKNYMDFDNSSETPDLNSWRLDFIFRMF